MPTKIFVGNLNEETSSSDVRQLFEKYGNITECDVLDKFAFVHMEDADEADKAINSLRGYLLHGNKIGVELSHSKRGEPRGGGRGGGGFRGRGGGDFGGGGFGGRGGRGGRGGYGDDRGFRGGGRGGRGPPSYERDPLPPRDPYDRYPPSPYDRYERDRIDDYYRDRLAARYDPYGDRDRERGGRISDRFPSPYDRPARRRSPDPYQRPPPEYYRTRSSDGFAPEARSAPGLPPRGLSPPPGRDLREREMLLRAKEDYLMRVEADLLSAAADRAPSFPPRAGLSARGGLGGLGGGRGGRGGVVGGAISRMFGMAGGLNQSPAPSSHAGGGQFEAELPTDDSYIKQHATFF